jgi:transposase InsO family protein
MARQYKENFRVDIATAARICGISYQSFWRYNRRLEAGEKPLEVVGRKPLPPIDHQEVRRDIEKLKHCNKRSLGSGEVLEKYDGIISRKKLEQMIAEVRRELKKGRRNNMFRIEWNCPHMVWSMDDFMYEYKGITFYVHQVQDLSSKYKFEPLVSAQPLKGEEIAGNLRKLFKKYGAPLIMKRDNGSNLNHFSVIEVLQESKVIPLNNPAYYPQFNGAMERAQGEVKEELDNLIWEFENPDTFPFAVRQAVHNMNHILRPTLENECSCFQWQLYADVSFTMIYRTQVYQEINKLALEIADNIQYSEKELLVSKSWRKAVEAWLQTNGHITIRRNGKVLPISDQTA